MNIQRTGILCIALDAIVAAVVVGVTIAIILAICLVVAIFVTDGVDKREAVMGRDEVDARVRSTVTGFENVG